MLKSLTILFALSFISMTKSPDTERKEFSYPKSADAVFSMPTDNYQNYTKEWQGSNYYYSCENGDHSIICSVLFQKLSKEDVQKFVENPQKAAKGPEISPLYPEKYFLANSIYKKVESNEKKWGGPTDDFMFCEFDVAEFNGLAVDQKHIYAYAMFGKDIFVSIHLSKADCSPEEAEFMRQLLKGLKKKK